MIYLLVTILAVTVVGFGWLVFDSERKVRQIRRENQEDE